MKTNKLASITMNEDSWRDQIFFTCDVDWASDEVIRYCADIFIENKIKVTWFCTHQSDYLKLLSQNEDLFEIAWHPNFNNLLSKESEGTVDSIFSSINKEIGEVKGFRSHSVTQSTGIISQARKIGLDYESNTFIPINSGITVKPYLHTSGMLQLPYVWEDDVHYLNKWNYFEELNRLLNYKGLLIVDFHPIHIFLNSAIQEHYDRARANLNDFTKLSNFVNNESYGTRDFLFDLMHKINL